MKKTYIALASAAAFAFTGAAAAEGVEVSANYQVQVMSVGGDKVGDDAGLYMNDGNYDGGGNWGRVNIGGSKDLGDGLSAVFAANSNLNAQGAGNNPSEVLDGPISDSKLKNTSGLFSREVYAGLKGDFGMLRLGRQNSGYSTAGKDPWVTTFMQARINGGMVGGGNGLGNGSYASNVVRYDNDFGGVKVTGSMILDAQSDGDEEHAMAALVQAPIGPASVWAGMVSADDHWLTADDAGSGRDHNLTKFGGSFSTGGMMVMAQMESGTYMGGDVNHMTVAGKFDMGNDNYIAANYGSESEAEATTMAVGYSHSLGAGTRVHVGYQAGDDGSDKDSDQSVIGGGLRISF